MMRLLRSEAGKSLGARSTWGIVAALVVLVLMGVLQTSTPAEASKPLWERQFYFLATIQLRLFVLVLAIKLVTDEFRFGTIVPTLLVTPRRGRVFGAKVTVLAVLGAGAALVTAAAMTLAAWSSLETFGREELRALLGYVASGAFWAIVGAGVGFVVRHQLAAVVGAVAWVMVGEQILMGRGRLGDYLPGGAAGGLAIPGSTGGTVVNGLILTGYAVALYALGRELFLRRDVP